ncbi:hypothetical protein [Thermobacillus sp.]|uniref:hypothetical protein n=1 Tax=Thermobacillus sp. TaxID=2108467 RepID=UPI0025804908|nr:hypothetical protein [Thermobacillus sp.]
MLEVYFFIKASRRERKHETWLSSTITVAVIEDKFVEKEKKYIHIRTEGGQRTKVEVSEIAWPLVEVGSEYSARPSCPVASRQLRAKSVG